MTSHQLAKYLVTQNDLPVVINGWGSNEGFTFEVTGAEEDSEKFFGPSNSGPIDQLGYPPDSLCVSLTHNDLP